MHLYVHKDRHIVVSQTEKPEDGTLQVAWVALSPTVDGVKKRGRHPNYEKPVSVADLAPYEGDVADTLRERAVAVLAETAPETTDQTEQ